MCHRLISSIEITEDATRAFEIGCPFSLALACRVVRLSSWTPRLCSRSLTYLLMAERDIRRCRAASEKLPSSTTFTKARMLVSLSMVGQSLIKNSGSRPPKRVRDCHQIIDSDVTTGLIVFSIDPAQLLLKRGLSLDYLESYNVRHPPPR
jgi:hypothetical protein